MVNVKRFLVAGMILLASAQITHAAEEIELIDRIVAVVNNDIVLLSELNDAMKPFIEQLKRQNLPSEKEKAMMAQVHEQMINRLIEEKLTDQEIKEYMITVGDEEIDNTIENLKSMNQYTDDDLKAFLEQENITLDDYRKKIKDQLLRRKLVNYRIKSKIVVTEEDIRSYYDAHPELYGARKKYHLKNIIMAKPAGATESELSEIRAAMEKIVQAIVNGESFEDLARQYSQSSAASRGGDLGIFEFESLSPQLQEAMGSLKSGEHTPVLDTDMGYQIFYVEEVITGTGKSFESVKPEIQDKLFTEVVDEKLKSWLKELRSRSHIKIIQ